VREPSGHDRSPPPKAVGGWSAGRKGVEAVKPRAPCHTNRPARTGGLNLSAESARTAETAQGGKSGDEHDGKPEGPARREERTPGGGSERETARGNASACRFALAHCPLLSRPRLRFALPPLRHAPEKS